MIKSIGITPIARLAAAVAMSFAATAAAHASSVLVNGDFQSGDLTGWSTYTTSNGTIGTPAVEVFDVVEGAFNSAAQLRVGQVSFGGSAAGGGISQIFSLANGGELSFLADIASKNTDPLYQNAEGGVFSMILDGITVSTYTFGRINSGITLRSSLSYTGILAAGTHELRIEALRPFLTKETTPLQFIDNVKVSAVPEADAVALLLAGIAVVSVPLARRRLGS